MNLGSDFRLKNKILILLLVLSLLISGGFNTYIISDKSRNRVQQIINNDIISQLSFLSGSMDGLKEDDNLKFISSTTGSIFWLSRSSNSIDHDTTVLFQEVNNFLVNSDVDKIYKNKTKLSELFKMLSITPNDKEIKMKLRNLIESLN